MNEQAELLLERLDLWKHIQQFSDGDISKSVIRDLNIYKGQSGVCRDDSGNMYFNIKYRQRLSR